MIENSIEGFFLRLLMLFFFFFKSVHLAFGNMAMSAVWTFIQLYNYDL